MGRDFNASAFLNLSDFAGIKELCEYIVELDQDDTRYNALRTLPMFTKEQDPKLVFDSIVEKVKYILL